MAVRQKGNAWQVDLTYHGIRAPRVSAPTRVQAERIKAHFKADLMAGRTPTVDGAPAAPTSQITKGATLGALVETTYRGPLAGHQGRAVELRQRPREC